MFRVAYSPIYIHPVPQNHRFPMEKYGLIRDQLLYEGVIERLEFFSPTPVSDDVLLTTHDEEYLYRLKNLQTSLRDQRLTGFVHTSQLVNREITIVGGTVRCAEFAIEHGASFNIAGGTHHAYADRGEGFCLLNDFAVAASYLLESEVVSRILIVDLDVHQGNGTAKIFENDQRVYTFSMHGAGNYPYRKETSDLDISLPNQTTDNEYLELLEGGLNYAFAQSDPDFIFYQCGVDPLEGDKLGRLALSVDGLKERDRMVLKLAAENNIPLCAAMGGGYAPDVKQIVAAHVNTFRLARDLFF